VRERLKKLGLLFALALFAGLFSFSIYRAADLAERGRQPARLTFVAEMTGAFTGVLLLPFLLAFLRRFPLERRSLARRLPLHAVAFVLFAVTHTLLMWGSRTVVYRLLGWGAYDYGDMRYRFLMEGAKQLLIYAMVVVIVTGWDRMKRSREQELRSERLTKELTQARLSALKMQLAPHFLFNTLNTIASLVHDDPDAADAMLGHLADFLRLTLKHQDVQEVALATELEFVAAYLAIMETRFEERLRVEVDVPAAARGALVPHLVLQPLVENAVAHCTLDHERVGRVRIGAERRDGRLRLSVEDNGPGVSGDPSAAIGRGIGLANTAARLAELYGRDHELSLENRPEGGLKVWLDVPYREAR